MYLALNKKKRTFKSIISFQFNFWSVTLIFCLRKCNDLINGICKGSCGINISKKISWLIYQSALNTKEIFFFFFKIIKGNYCSNSSCLTLGKDTHIFNTQIKQIFKKLKGCFRWKVMKKYQMVQKWFKKAHFYHETGFAATCLSRFFLIFWKYWKFQKWWKSQSLAGEKPDWPFESKWSKINLDRGVLRIGPSNIFEIRIKSKNHVFSKETKPPLWGKMRLVRRSVPCQSENIHPFAQCSF